MRPIEFRAWEKNREEMIPVNSINFETGIINGDSAWRHETELELMQYTGLRDKNGVKIFEGDIVLNNDYTWQVTWEMGTVSILHNDGHSKWWIASEEEHCEVIGNIHQNGDLLK